MNGIIDFHSHILPELDDGSDSAEMSLEMLKWEVQQGIRQVIATPHFYAMQDHPSEFLERRQKSEEKLRKAMEGHRDLPQVSVGAEVRFFPGMSDSDWLTALTIQQKKCILIEMPDVPWTESNYRELALIHEKCGVLPVVAHVDRYIGPFRNHGIPERLEQLPVLVQANASFFLNFRTRGLAMKMLRKGQIHLLGSDCHNLALRPPNLGQALEQIQKHLGEEVLDRIRYYQDMVNVS